MKTKTKDAGKKILMLSWELGLVMMITGTAIYILSIAFSNSGN